MRWYNITAKCYNLDNEKHLKKRSKSDDLSKYKHDFIFIKGLYLNYSLHKLASMVDFKVNYQIRKDFFCKFTNTKDQKILIKSGKIIFNAKQYSD